MKKLLILLPIFIFIACGQTFETTYALNSGVTQKGIQTIDNVEWGNLKEFPQSSYVKIKMKPDGSFYINTTVNGQFAYGHYFKYCEMYGEDFKYQRTDGDSDEFIFSNYSLESLAKSNQYDEHIVLKMINQRTNFGMLFKF